MFDNAVEMNEHCQPAQHVFRASSNDTVENAIRHMQRHSRLHNSYSSQILLWLFNVSLIVSTTFRS